MEIKDSGERTEFESGAVRDMHEGKGRYDLMPWDAVHELALHCEAGAKKYGERNCEKGIPVHSLIDSAIRHLSCYLRGMKDEPHLRAAMWNIAYAIWTEKNRPDLIDIPCRMADKPEETLKPGEFVEIANAHFHKYPLKERNCGNCRYSSILACKRNKSGELGGCAKGDILTLWEPKE